MSSPARVRVSVSTFSSPRSRAAASMTMSAIPGSLTVAALVRSYFTVAETPHAAAVPATTRRIFSGSARPVSGVKERAVPASVTLEGMTLKAVPPWIDPIVTTAESRGEISRETTDCSDSTMRAAARIGSAASCGIAPWPPRPSTSIENWSTAAMRAPRLIPIFPTGIGLQRCRPSAAATPSSAPSRTQDSAPPAPSSAGW